MTLIAEEKEKIMTEFKTHEGDTGSPEVQVALATDRINRLTEHFKAFKKDNQSRRGLLRLIGHRRKQLDYLESKSHKRYKSLIAKLGIRK